MKKIGCIVFLVILFLGLGYTYFSYWYVFSEGTREGLLNKFSTKGLAYKTNEGELLLAGMVPNMPQMSSNVFYFSVQDSAVVSQLMNATGKKVKVHYKQFRKPLPWRGDDYSPILDELGKQTPNRNQESGQYIVASIEVVN